MATIAGRVQARIDRHHVDRVIGEWGGRDFLRGRAAEPGDIVLTGNDYLALTGDRRIAEPITAVLSPDSAAALPDACEGALAYRMAEYLRAGAGIVCQSGWDANLGLLQAIADPATPVYLDEHGHMSLRQGARLAGAPIQLFRHNSATDLAERIHAHGPGVIAVDAVSSTDGERSPLRELCDVADDTGSLLVVDESHTLGIDGPRGAGAVVGADLVARVPFRTASLAKAFAGRAGFIAAPHPGFVDYFRGESYPAVFSSGLRSPDLAGLAATLDVVRACDDRRRRLREVAATVRKALCDKGFDLGGGDGQIVALQTGPATHGLAVRDVLERHGVLGAMFCAPATPPDRTLIRFSLHSALTDEQVERIIAACAEISDVLGPVPPGVPVGGR
ncbi:aminotransferase class I/II-fold pyridoxal phosphate-dependent enzyme [Nocardia sp. NPDC048505]|uniref:aminotransferase class I/II-fold pyridoxal phosphate-dependent enzyme n=1 Tax=Nocardia sp. NPDC048505 TaxID=3155756 RepID=UPI0033F68CBC